MEVKDTVLSVADIEYCFGKTEEEAIELRKVAEFQADRTADLLKNQWISVKDKLPLGQWNVNHHWLSEEVLIANSCSVNIGFYDRRRESWFVNEPIKEECIDKITHWMLLPENPHSTGFADRFRRAVND